MKQIRIRPSAAVLAAALSTMALYACNQGGPQTNTQSAAAAPPALPLTTGAETAPVYAPAASGLPAAPRPKIVRVASQADQYAYVDQASSMGSALGSAPPDYGFDYDGVRPWVWRASDNAARLVEPVSGGYRDYYYQPGASEPYLIRDPQYAYGFSNGQLVVVYDARGQILPPQYVDRQADDAGRYLARAQALYNASLRNQRSSVIAANWAARRAEFEAQQAAWAQQQSQHSAWQAYHEAHEAQQQAYWHAERQRRDAAAAQFNQWQGAGYQGPPPPPPSYAPATGVAGAALVGAAAGAYIAGHDHRDDRGPPQGEPGAPPPNRGAGFGYRPDQPHAAPVQGAAIAEARQQQAQADAAHQAQLRSEAQAAAAARAQTIAQGRSQQVAAEAARQAQAQAAKQARQQDAAQVLAARQAQEAAKAQGKVQALAARQAQDAARVQAATLAHQQKAADAAAQHQAQDAARLQAAQAHHLQAAQAAAKTQAAAAAHPPHGDHPHPGGPRPEDGPRPPAAQQ